VNQGWKREIRVFDFCIAQAEQIIGELRHSGGDHSEDVEILEGLIESWDHLRAVSFAEEKEDELRRVAESKLPEGAIRNVAYLSPSKGSGYGGMP
jgi:hypothetical protein